MNDLRKLTIEKLISSLPTYKIDKKVPKKDPKKEKIALKTSSTSRNEETKSDSSRDEEEEELAIIAK